MLENNTNINVIELLMQIKEDVSSIKTDMNNFKDAQRIERANIDKEFRDVRADYNRDLQDLKASVMSEIKDIITVQNTLVSQVNTLQHAEEAKDAKKWKRVIAFFCTGIGGIVIAKLPEILNVLLRTAN